MTEALDDALDGLTDAALIAAVRRGSTAAYGALYERHLGAARRAARSWAASAVAREDLIAEAFTLVLRALRTGCGPVTEFRPYLLVVMRNLVIAASRQVGATVLFDEVPESLLAGGADDDPVTAQVVAGQAAAAFVRLPPRWRMVLWHTEIEGESPAVLALRWGLTANGVAALASRAREGLRQAFLELHLPPGHHTACRTTRGHLAAWVRRGEPRQTMTRVGAHLGTCTDCRTVAARLANVNRDLCRHWPEHCHRYGA